MPYWLRHAWAELASASASIPGAELVLDMGGCRPFLSGSLLFHLVLMESAGAVPRRPATARGCPGSLLWTRHRTRLTDMDAVIEFPLVSVFERWLIIIGPMSSRCDALYTH